MPVFVRNRPMARVGAAVELHTPWRRWWAWYPVTDMNITYWLCWVEWRSVVADGMATTHPFRVPPRIEYRAV
jgi:hypothetical protein